MKWTKDKPTTIGIYLACDYDELEVGALEKVDVYKGEDEDDNVMLAEVSGVIGAIEEFADTYWWFGPLPPLPKGV